MKTTQRLHDAGQSLWLDNITRSLLTGRTLSRYIGELSVTGLTSNPTIFDHAIKNSHDYDAAIREKTAAGLSGEELFFELALEDLTRAADLFRPIHEATNGVDGWVSLEVSPLLAHDTNSTLAAAITASRLRRASARSARPTPARFSPEVRLVFVTVVIESRSAPAILPERPDGVRNATGNLIPYSA